jgi:two-component system response regulator RegA
MSFEASTSILLVDDDVTFLHTLAERFVARAFSVRTASTYDAAMAAIAADPPELAVVDMRLSDARPQGGVGLVRAIHDADGNARVVVLTGYGSIASTVAAMRAGAVSYVQKPATVGRLLDALAGRDDGEDEARIVPSLGRLEWEHLQRVLGDAGGNVSEAARRLGMHRRSLQRKLARGPRSEI